MEQKYLIIVSRRGRKRAVNVKKESQESAIKHAEQIMRVNYWTDAEVYEHDCYTPAMEDGYILAATAKVRGDKIEWKYLRLKPVTNVHK